MDHKDFLEQCCFRLNESLERIQLCLNKLSQKQVWTRPNDQLNSIGNLVLHLQGNIGQYIMSGLGGQTDNRKRSQEFVPDQNVSKAVLANGIEDCIKEATDVISALNSEQLVKNYSIQGFDLTGTGTIIHVVEHLSYHTGQIAFLTKLIMNEDLGFYAGLDLDVTG